MSTSTFIDVISILLLILASAFFSSSETALTAANTIRLRQFSDGGDEKSSLVLRLLEEPQRLISTILIGNNIVNIASTSLATVFFTNLYGSQGPLVATIVMTIFVLIFGEILPKTIAQMRSIPVSRFVAKPIYGISLLLKPLSFIFNRFTTFVTQLFFKDDEDTPSFTEQELKTIIEVGEEEGVLQSDEKVYIDNVLDFSNATALDMMRPRTSVLAIDIDITQEDLLALLQNAHYSRIPVYEDTIDNIIGILYMKDVVRALASGEEIVIGDMLREPYFIGESAVAQRIFRELKERNLSIAVVVDEYAGTSGIITMEDILEELVGNIDDEYDFESSQMIILEEDVYLLDPELRIDEVNAYFNLEFVSEKSDSIGGYVIEKLDRIPVQGDIVTVDSIVFTVNEMQGLKMKKLKMNLRGRENKG